MTERFQTDHRELDDLFERYRTAPGSHVFAPLADACRKAGMLEEALEICARGVSDNPRYASGYVVQGKCLYDAGRSRDAQAAFERVLELDPKNLVALKFLGIINAERGDSRGAREYFEHILALDPGDREIRSRMEDGSADMASTLILQPVKPAPTARGSEPAGDTVADDDDTVELPDIEDETFEGDPITLRDESITSDEIATITLADIYASQGYTSRALKIYREVHRRQPDNRQLAAKISKFERDEKTQRESAASARVDKPSPVAPPEKTTSPASPDPAGTQRARAEASAPKGSAAPSSGHPIDQSRSYEQFKRWLKSTSR